LPYSLGQLSLSKFPGIQEALLGEINVLHGIHVLCGRLADTRHHHDWVGFENNSVVHELVDGERLGELAHAGGFPWP